MLILYASAVLAHEIILQGSFALELKWKRASHGAVPASLTNTFGLLI